LKIVCPSCHSDSLHSRGSTRAGTKIYRCSECDRSTTEPISPDNVQSVIKKDKPSTRLMSKKRFVITAAQDSTPIHSKFFEALQHYDAELLVVPYRYKNPTSLWSKSNDDEWWDSRIAPYLIEDRNFLHENCILLSDLKLQPTKVNPLTGLHGFSRTESLVVAHPKVAMETVATHPGDMAKIVTSTGAITVPDYTDSSAGKRGNHHHVHGAVVVECDGDVFHIRHIHASDDGSFIDLDTEYTSEGKKPAPPAKALVLGDIHHYFMDESVDSAVFGKNGLVQTLEPECVVLHDPVDNYAINPHIRNDPFTNLGKYKNSRNSVKQELEDFSSWLKNKEDGREFVIVNSNHSDWLQRWIKECDWKTDPENAEFYLETALHLVKNTVWTSGGVSTPDAFNYWMNRLVPFAKVLNPDDSYNVMDHELGNHGHLGPNGSRGSLASLSKLGPKTIFGHVHSPGIREGAIAVGVSTYLNLNYTSGPSAWLQSHAYIDAKGKAKLINTINGMFSNYG